MKKTSSVILLSVGFLISSCGDSKKTEKSTNILPKKEEVIIPVKHKTDPKKDYLRTAALRTQFLGKKLNKVRFDFDFGNPKTLDGTDGSYWLVYFKEKNLTVLSDKSNEEIINIANGKKASLISDKTVFLLKEIGKEYTYNDFQYVISSIKYGKIEKLTKEACLNKECVEYYPKGNFTSVSYKRFDDNGDFVTLKKIGMGKLPLIQEYSLDSISNYKLSKSVSKPKKSNYSKAITENKEYKALTTNSELIGRWYVEHKMVKSMNWHYEIYKHSSKYSGVMITKSPKIEMLKKAGSKYTIINNKHGEYYTLKNGVLKMFDGGGEISDYKVTKLD